jgi:hypothetical protein
MELCDEEVAPILRFIAHWVAAKPRGRTTNALTALWR